MGGRGFYLMDVVEENVMHYFPKEKYTPAEYRRFLAQCPIFERLLIDDGILLHKYWFSVSDEEQERRFRARQGDPMRRWKLSPMDVESILRWDEYSRAKDEMFVHTDLTDSPWWMVEGDDKRRVALSNAPRNVLLATDPGLVVIRSAIELPPQSAAVVSYT